MMFYWPRCRLRFMPRRELIKTSCESISSSLFALSKSHPGDMAKQQKSSICRCHGKSEPIGKKGGGESSPIAVVPNLGVLTPTKGLKAFLIFQGVKKMCVCIYKKKCKGPDIHFFSYGGKFKHYCSLYLNLHNK